MKRTSLFVLIALVLAVLLPTQAQAQSRRRGRTIRSAQERTMNIADNAVDLYCSRYDCSNMDRGAPYWSGHPYRYNQRSDYYGGYYDAPALGIPNSPRTMGALIGGGGAYLLTRDKSAQTRDRAVVGGALGGLLVGHFIEKGQNSKENEQTMLSFCQTGDERACMMLAAKNPKKYGFLAQRGQPPPERYTDSQEEVRNTRRTARRPANNEPSRRSARRLDILVTNLSRYEALVFDGQDREVLQVPGNSWSGVSQADESWWAALNVDGGWCQSTVTKNSDTDFTINKITTCIKVVVQ